MEYKEALHYPYRVTYLNTEYKEALHYPYNHVTSDDYCFPKINLPSSHMRLSLSLKGSERE